MSDIDPTSENVYVHSLEVNGNLIVKGTIYSPQNQNNCPEELMNSTLEIVKTEDLMLEGNLHVHPAGKFKISGRVTSSNFRSQYE